MEAKEVTMAKEIYEATNPKVAWRDLSKFNQDWRIENARRVLQERAARQRKAA